jgi:CRP-like cAMP-binding protein
MKIKDETLLSQHISRFNLFNFFSKENPPTFELFQFQKGELLLRSGEISDYFFILTEGQLKVYNYSLDGKIIFLSQLDPFQVIGEIASLWGWEATANVEANSEVRCIGINLDRHREDLLNDLVFLRFLCQEMALKTISNNKYFSSTMFDSLDSRLAALLVNNAVDGKTKPKLSEWAELLCITYRHLLRTLNKFIEKGILEKQNQSYFLLDQETLREMAYPKLRR